VARHPRRSNILAQLAPHTGSHHAIEGCRPTSVRVVRVPSDALFTHSAERQIPCQIR
jgi:hypothetical protein